MANYERPNAPHKPALPAKSCLLHKGAGREMQEVKNISNLQNVQQVAAQIP